MAESKTIYVADDEKTSVMRSRSSWKVKTIRSACLKTVTSYCNHLSKSHAI